MMTGLIKATVVMIGMKDTIPDIVRLFDYASRDLRRCGRMGGLVPPHHDAKTAKTTPCTVEVGARTIPKTQGLVWSGRIHAVDPGLRIQREGVAAPRQPRERREMQVHPGDQDAVSADAIEHAFARAGCRREIGVEGHAGFGKRSLYLRHV